MAPPETWLLNRLLLYLKFEKDSNPTKEFVIPSALPQQCQGNRFLHEPSTPSTGSSRPKLEETPEKNAGFDKPENPKTAESKHRQLVRKRTKKYGELQKAITKCEQDAAKGVAKASEDIKKFEQDNKADLPSYEHFMRLAKVKLRVLAAITEQPNAEGADVVKSGLTQEDQSLLPCGVDLLRKPAEIKRMLQNFLTIGNDEDLEQQRKTIGGHIGQLRMLCNTTVASVCDLASAKNSRIRDAQREEQKEKRKADAEAAREAKRLKKEADAQALAVPWLACYVELLLLAWAPPRLLCCLLDSLGGWPRIVRSLQTLVIASTNCQTHAISRCVQSEMHHLSRVMGCFPGCGPILPAKKRSKQL